VFFVFRAAAHVRLLTRQLRARARCAALCSAQVTARASGDGRVLGALTV
jgi:hypothetical protein